MEKINITTNFYGNPLTNDELKEKCIKEECTRWQQLRMIPSFGSHPYHACTARFANACPVYKELLSSNKINIIKRN